MLLYNTLTGKKEEFTPIEKGVALVYTCGPTVYNFAHIGNLRAYVFADVLRRTLEYSGLEVKQVVNITDVGHLTSDSDEGDDKMVRALKREGLPMTLEGLKRVADKYTAAFVHDLKALNIRLPAEMPRASEHITEDVEMIKKLVEKGAAYRTSDGMYFDISKFPAYGTRGGFKLGNLKEGARVAANPEKKSPHDFALWKFASGELPAFQSPFGPGYPGWHIECSAMSRKYLGQPFDIHTGGIDHIPVHHQNEIAQSETAFSAPLANFWMHSEFVTMSGGKMAKSEENFITLRTLMERGIHPLAYRYYLLQAHYRSPIVFSWKALEAAQNAYFKLLFKFSLLPKGDMFRVNPLRLSILQAAGDDLNTARVLSEMWVGFQAPIRKLERNICIDYDEVLGLDIENQSKKLTEEMNAVPENIKKLAAAREDARREKDFVKGDMIRDEIRAAGFEITDTDSQPIVRKNN